MSAIKKLHDRWAEKILPKDAPQIQRQECERAFYSGFYSSLLLGLHRLASLPDDQAAAELDALYKESEAYFKTLGQAPRDIFRS